MQNVIHIEIRVLIQPQLTKIPPAWMKNPSQTIYNRLQRFHIKQQQEAIFTQNNFQISKDTVVLVPQIYPNHPLEGPN